MKFFSLYIQNCQLPYSTVATIKATAMSIDISMTTTAVISLAKSIGTIGNRAKTMSKTRAKARTRTKAMTKALKLGFN